MRVFAIAILAGALVTSAAGSALAQQTIKIGELNSYKSQPAFLDPYKKGWEMAVDEINAAGGVLEKSLKSFPATTVPILATPSGWPRSLRPATA